MSVEIAWKQNILVTDFKSGFKSRAGYGGSRIWPAAKIGLKKRASQQTFGPSYFVRALVET